MTMDVLPELSLNQQPLCNICKCEAARKREHKEANQEKDATDKSHAAAKCKTPLNNNNEHSSKHGQKEYFYYHSRTKSMMCSSNPLLIISGIL